MILTKNAALKMTIATVTTTTDAAVDVMMKPIIQLWVVLMISQSIITAAKKIVMLLLTSLQDRFRSKAIHSIKTHVPASGGMIPQLSQVNVS